MTVNTTGQRARVDTSPPFVGSHATFSTTNIIKTGRNKDPNRSNTFTASAGDQIIFHFNTTVNPVSDQRCGDPTIKPS